MHIASFTHFVMPFSKILFSYYTPLNSSFFDSPSIQDKINFSLEYNFSDVGGRTRDMHVHWEPSTDPNDHLFFDIICWSSQFR